MPRIAEVETEEEVVVVTSEVDVEEMTGEVVAEEVVELLVEVQASMLLTRLHSHHLVRLLFPKEMGTGRDGGKIFKNRKPNIISRTHHRSSRKMPLSDETVSSDSAA